MRTTQIRRGGPRRQSESVQRTTTASEVGWRVSSERAGAGWSATMAVGDEAALLAAGDGRVAQQRSAARLLCLDRPAAAPKLLLKLSALMG